MDLSILNKEQKEAVLYNDGPLLIIAGAGSGKTRVITYKVAYLIENGVDPSSILAITFTNKASNEMRDRVEKLLNGDSKKVFISTFHKFCGRILRTFIDSIGYDRNFSIYDTNDQKKIMKKIIKDFGYDEKKIKEKAALSHISFCKNHGISIDEYEKTARTDTEKVYAKLFREYDKQMFASNAIDFDDMLLLTVRILKENDYARTKLSNKFKYILVDEYQDTNLVQFEIVKYLTIGTDNRLTVVGDDDQSIYKFRGATITNILSFEDNFKGAKTIKLTQNYRSTNNILKSANSVICNNYGRKEKELWSENGDGEKVEYTEYEDDGKEAYSIINNIKKNGKYNDTAILYRTNSQSRKFEEMCVSLSIPYTLIGGVNFYERMEIKDIVAYLAFISNQNDNNALSRIINVPKRGLGDTTMSAIIEYATKKNLTLYKSFMYLDDISIKTKARQSIREFVNLIEELKKEKEIDVLIDKLLDSGYRDYLYDEYEKDEAEERINNILELKNKAITFKQVYPDIIENDFLKEFAKTNSAFTILDDFLSEIALVADTDDLDDENDRLTLMSLHASKGLEFDTVYITGLNEGVFPSYQSITSDDPSDVEEERRLCYVGITRAKKKLYISSAKRRMQNGSYNTFKSSRFVDELSDEFCIKNRMKEVSFSSNNYEGTEFWSYKKRDFVKKKLSDYNTNNTSKHSVSRQELNKSIDTYKTGKNIVKEAKLSYAIGDVVRHIKFGDGKVTDIVDVGRDYEVTVDFDDYGTKTLFAAFAKLEKI